jgi:WD40 repeat protein
LDGLKVSKLEGLKVDRLKVAGLRLLGSIICVAILGACAALTPPDTSPRDTLTPETLFTDTPFPTLTITPTLTATATDSRFPTPENISVISFPAPGPLHHLRWSADGAALAVAVGTDIHIYDSSLVEQRIIPLGIWVERLAFHPSQPILGAALKDGSIRFWSTVSGDEICKFTAHSKGANSLAFQPGGNLLATTGTDIISRMWDISSVLAGGCDVKPAGQLIGSSYTAPAVLFSDDGKMLALVDIKDIYLRESQTRKLIAVLRGDLPIFDIALSPNGHWLAAAQNNAIITLWDVTAKPRPTYTLLHFSHGMGYTWRVDFSADGSLLAGTTSSGEILVWQLSDLQPVFSRSLGHAVSGLAFNPITSALTVGTLDGSVYLYSIK